MLLISRQLLLKQALKNGRDFMTSSNKRADVTHTVIGGGVIGLAIARQLASRDNTSTVLIERNRAVGMETSSRNSEVIHAGLYYGKDTLKTELCIRGKQMLYHLCLKYSIPHAKVKKWIVAQTEHQREYLEKLYQFSRSIDGAPTKFISREVAQGEEPLVRARSGILESSTTGIIDSHAYMQLLLNDFQKRDGDVALFNTVTSIEALGTRGSQGWAITVKNMRTGEYNNITSEVIINAAGLYACDISNMVLPLSQHRKQFYAKGNYFSCTHPLPFTRHLIYPAPEPGSGGLGTHLTIDLAGRTRFGPDLEWVESPTDLNVNSSRLPQAIEEIKHFLPCLDPLSLVPDYAGIRPKLLKNAAVGSGKNFVDFYIQKEPNFEGFVNLLGIESPGLTSSLAIAEMVDRLL